MVLMGFGRGCYLRSRGAANRNNVPVLQEVGESLTDVRVVPGVVHFLRVHMTLKTTPAGAVGLASDAWTMARQSKESAQAV
jgi:hypothetical protein